jgi:hypothetical protein
MEITTALSIYAAILSTAVFFWNVSRSRPKIRVKLIYSLEEIKGEYVSGVGVAVQNPSAHTVHITNVSLVYPWRKPTTKDYAEHIFRFRRWPRRIGWCHTSLSNHDVDDGCPVALEPGTSHRVLVPADKLEEILKDATKRRFVAVVQDALWRDKYSDAFDYPAHNREQVQVSNEESLPMIEQNETASEDAAS